MTVRSILFASGAANLGGLQSSTHSRILGLKATGIKAEKLFVKSGAGRDTYSDVPVHLTDDPDHMARIVHDGKFDAISMINRIDLLPVLHQVEYRGRVLYEVRGKAMHALKALHRLSPTQVGGIVVISNYVKKLVQEALPMGEIPIHVVYNGVDTTLFRPLSDVDRNHIPFALDAEKRPIILWVGRLSKDKNYTEMLRVAVLLRNQRPRPMFWVVADTKARDNRQAFWEGVRKRSLQGHIRLLECVPHRDMPHIYNLVGMSGGCVLSTSKTEGFQNSLLEGMACGVPVVGSAVGGNVEMITNGINGRLYQLGKPQEAVDSLIQILDDPVLREAYTTAGLERVALRHTPKKHVQQFLDALNATEVVSYGSDDTLTAISDPLERKQKLRKKLEKKRARLKKKRLKKKLRRQRAKLKRNLKLKRKREQLKRRRATMARLKAKGTAKVAPARRKPKRKHAARR